MQEYTLIGEKMGTTHHFRWTFWTVTAVLIVGWGLTVISWLGICTEECAVGHLYRLYGFPFEVVGFAFFTSAALIHSFSWWKPALSFLLLLLFAGALGSETLFLMVQKYWIGHWCPICVSIAITLTIGAITLFIYQYRLHKGDIMKNIWKGTSTTAVFVLGFLVAFLGVSQVNPLEAKQDALKDQLAFGNTQSPIEIYLFTDWACPACRKIEPHIEKMAPGIMKEAQLYFVDFVIHPETLNYIPYNVSFMVHNKSKYLVLRHVLTKLSLQTGSPTHEQIEQIAGNIQVTYTPLSYAEIAQANRLFKELGHQFRVRKTPTMIVYNPAIKKGKRLEGSAEITQEKVQEAIRIMINA